MKRRKKEFLHSYGMVEVVRIVEVVVVVSVEVRRTAKRSGVGRGRGEDETVSGHVSTSARAPRTESHITSPRHH